MYQKLLNHNSDLRQLRDTGYAIDVTPSYLIVRHIPYLDDKGELQFGVIATQMLIYGVNVKQENHQIYFAGSLPYGLDGKTIQHLGPQTAQRINLGDKYSQIMVRWAFSNKPPNGYKDFFEKIETYVAIISGPAIEKYPYATYLTFEEPLNKDEDMEEIMFEFPDTLSSRSKIEDISAKLNKEVVAIIGLGGTGSYILDFLVKTPVKEIRIFDFDIFELHNAYRSPGKMDSNEFKKYKTDVYEARYNNFNKGIVKYNKAIDASCVNDLEGVTFAFVAVDSGEARNNIISILTANKIPFIDTGIGINRDVDSLSGLIRTTYFPIDEKQIAENKKQIPITDGNKDIYQTNIQIAELNALNACIAVMRYKQLKCFYTQQVDDDLQNYNIFFDVTDIYIVGE